MSLWLYVCLCVCVCVSVCVRVKGLLVFADLLTSWLCDAFWGLSLHTFGALTFGAAEGLGHMRLRS